jgi:hypothetical protein
MRDAIDANGRLIPMTTADVVATLRGGMVRAESDLEISKAIERIQETGKAAKLVIELTLCPRGEGNREVHISAKVKSTLPQKLGVSDASIYFAERGKLYQDDPAANRAAQEMMAKARLGASD